MPDTTVTSVAALKDKDFKRTSSSEDLNKALNKEMPRFGTLVMSYAESGPPRPAQPAAAAKPAPAPH